MSPDPLLLLLAIVVGVCGVVNIRFAERLSAWNLRFWSKIGQASRRLLAPIQRILMTSQALRIGGTIEIVIGAVLLVLAFLVTL